jgi:hypothetical protein
VKCEVQGKNSLLNPKHMRNHARADAVRRLTQVPRGSSRRLVA